MQQSWQGSAKQESSISHGPPFRDKLEAGVDHVTVWWLDLKSIREDDWQLLESLLEDSELERSTRFHFDRDRDVYIAAHALTRGLLTWWTGLPARDWRFTAGDHGKPEVTPPPGLPRLRVNLSHTRELAAVALTVDNDVGVDVEWLERVNDVDQLAKRVFAADERALLAATPSERKTEIFLTFWTLKEAYVKAIGKGLSQPLDAFAFTLEPPVIRFDDIEADDAALWRFRHLRPTDRHKLAVGVRHPHPERLSMEIGEAPLDYLRNLGAARSSSA